MSEEGYVPYGLWEAGGRTPDAALQGTPTVSCFLQPGPHLLIVTTSHWYFLVMSPSVDFPVEVRVPRERCCMGMRFWETFQIQASGAETTVWVRCAKAPHSTSTQELSGKSLE